MKKTLTLFIALAVFALANAQVVSTPTSNSSAEVLQLKEIEFDFGKIPQGKPVYHSFTIVNAGTTPLKLDNVQASCGCTTPQWSQEPIAAGGNSEIKVGYNSAAEGAFDKVITITYNTNQTKQIRIKGTVWKAPDGAGPANASVEFLKKQNF